MPTEVKQVKIIRDKGYEVHCEHCDTKHPALNYLDAMQARREHIATPEHKANAEKAAS